MAQAHTSISHRKGVGNRSEDVKTRKEVVVGESGTEPRRIYKRKEEEAGGSGSEPTLIRGFS